MMMKRMRRFIGDERGASALEYGLIIALVAIVITFQVSRTGRETRTLFNRVNSRVWSSSSP